MKKVASCNKERTPFQSQVTKIGERDASLKDYILAGSALQKAARLDGTITADVHLPNETIPSDHSMVLADVWNSKHFEEVESSDESDGDVRWAVGKESR